MKKKNRITLFLQYIIVVGLLTGLDQWTKYLAVRHLKGQEDIPLIPGALYLHYLENRGAAFGLFQNQLVFFIIMTLLVLAAVLYVFWKLPSKRRFVYLKGICFLVSAGAVGNFMDRVRLNYVVDFIYFSPIDFPVFNVADIYVVASMILFLILILFYYKEDEFSFLRIGGKG